MSEQTQSGAKPGRRKFYMRFTNASDTRKVIDYYNSQKHKHIAVREPDVFAERVRNGAVVILEDEKGDIQAASISYPLEHKGRHRWTEVGSTRISLNGFGLLPYLYAAQTLHTFMFEPPDDRFVLETDNDNDKMQALLEKMKWAGLKLDKDMHKAAKDTMDPNSASDDVKWYQMGPEHMPHQARTLLKLDANPVLKNKRTGEEIEIDLSGMVILRKGVKPVLQQLARQKLGRPDKPDPKRRLRDLHKHMR